jgi:hypothetical protein
MSQVEKLARSMGRQPISRELLLAVLREWSGISISYEWVGDTWVIYIKESKGGGR